MNKSIIKVNVKSFCLYAIISLLLEINIYNPALAQGNNTQQPYQNYSYSQPNYGLQPYQNNGYSQPIYAPQPYQNNGYSQPIYAPQPYQSPAYSAPASNVASAQHNEAAKIINQAYALTKSGNNEEAIPLLKQAIAIEPSSDTAHMDLAVAYIALKRYDEALRESNTALQLNPNNEHAYLDYLAAAIGTNHMQDALRIGQEYLNRFPNGPERSKLTNEMVAIQSEMSRRANSTGVAAPPGAPDNYLSLATPNGRCAWPLSIMPLKVFIYPGKGNKGFDLTFVNVLINAFMTWQNATHGMIGFVPINDRNQANIECKWTDSAVGRNLAAEAGDAKVVRTGTTISHVTITLLTCRPENPSEKLPLTLLRQVCLHEIGHALGIAGHSDEAQDIMYCATTPNVEQAQLSARDLNTLWLLYH